MKVMVVEDNAANIALMSYLLRAAGHEVTEIGDGESAITAVNTLPPQVVVCDIDLPGISGYEVAAALKRNSATKIIPLVAVTAFAMPGDREKALKHGFDGYMAKPIEPMTFVRQIESFAHSARNAPTKAPPPLAARVLVVDNSEVNLEVIRSMLEPPGYSVMTAVSVDEGLAAATERTPDLVLCDIHMKGRDGFDLVRAFRAQNGLSHVPIVLVSSGLEVDDYTRQARALGAGFLSRPFLPARLLAVVRSSLKDRRDRRDAPVMEA